MRRASQDESAPIVLLESRRPRPAPVRFGGYELIGEIATGGMGTVYLARREAQAGFQRLFALKLMHEHLAREQRFVEMLLDEARLAARIHHHNVVSVVDLGESERGHYVVMEYVEGCSLAQLLRARRELGSRGVVPLIIDTLSGLHAAHTLTDEDGDPLLLVHRDVSPQNVLIGIDGVARITDFGIAKARARITSTMPGVRKGKLAYTAPEQLDGSVEIDARADVFATGAVLWSALTGRRLFHGATDAETVRNLLRKQIPPPSEVSERAPRAYDQVCLRALQRDPDRRFDSAAEMADALRRAAASAGGLATPAEIAAGVEESFAEDLAARRLAIREAVRRTRFPSGTAPIPNIPGLFENPSSQTFAATGEESLEVEIDYGSAGLRGRRNAMWLAAGVLAGVAAVALVAAAVGGDDAAPAPVPDAVGAPAAAPPDDRDHAVRVAPVAPEVTPLPEDAPEPELAPKRRPTRHKPRSNSRPVPEPEPEPKPEPKPEPEPKPAPRRDVLDEIETNPYTR